SATAPVADVEERVVTHLPGFHGPLPFSLQTGYVEVEERHGVRLFYYFIRSERSPADDPIVLWLSGGPGCSAFTALVYQIGPLRFELHGHTHTDDGGLPKLVYTSESWTKVSNIIFLDSPVGAGFSYSVTEQGYATSDTKAVDHILIFLSKWFHEHPEFLSNPLYIGGDSYAGIIVPTVTSAIASGTSAIASGKLTGSEPALNLKGYIVGNPVTDANFDNPSRIPFAHGMGLISDEIYERLKDIFLFHILEPLCPDDESPHPYNNVLKMKLSSGVQHGYAAEEPHLSYISTKCRVSAFQFLQ
ncbi:hypothetical protein U9M48_013902, partial [Paspalum notatum var. saurae]